MRACVRAWCLNLQGNHIRAGKNTPADALLSLYAYFADMLQGNGHCTGEAYIDRVTVPNLVGTGVFTDRMDMTSLNTNGLVSSSNKFPGRAITLSTGCTPVVYPGCDFTNKKWILPGMTSVEQTFASIDAMHAVTHGTSANLELE